MTPEQLQRVEQYIEVSKLVKRAIELLLECGMPMLEMGVVLVNELKDDEPALAAVIEKTQESFATIIGAVFTRGQLVQAMREAEQRVDKH